MKLILLLILLTPLFLFAQEEIIIPESTDIEICGRTLQITGFWIDNGIIKADISNYMQKNSKPLMGGYKINDTIRIKEGCSYKIVYMEKFGLNNTSKGRIVLSNSIDFTRSIPRSDEFTMGHGDEYNLGNEKWKVKNVLKNSAIIEITDKDLNVKTVELRVSDMIWFGESAYYISDFQGTAAVNQWLMNLKKIKDYSYLNTKDPVIPGEDINAPHILPRGETELIIRKMKYYPKQKFNKEEFDNTPVKYWVLKVMYYHGGMARPVIEVERDGKKMFLEYDAYKSYETEEEVLEFAKVNKITDIILEEK